MANIVLLHGYGVGLSPNEAPLADHLGFAGFHEMIQQKSVSIFPWYQEEKHSAIYFLNPANHLKVYKKEKAAVSDRKVLSRLDAFLQKEQSQTLVCHSLGSLLLLSYIQHFTLPKSVKKVVLVQADVPKDLVSVCPKATLEELTSQVDILNIFCPWDPALLTTWRLNKYIPAGLTGTTFPNIKNKMIPLFGQWNLHTATIMQKQFAQFVAAL